MRTRLKIIPKLAALAFGAAFLLQAPAGAAQDQPRDSGERRIAVSGTGEVSAPPDIALITVGAYAMARSAGEALNQTSAAVGAMIDALKAAGVAGADIRTAALTLSPRWEHRRRADGSMEQVQTGYEARNQLMVTARDLSGLGALLDALSKAGANEIGGISFDIDERTALEDQARALAVDDARRKAELLAARAGARLGAVMQVSEGGYIPLPQPVMRAEMAMAADVVPVAAGTQTIRVDVSTVWALE